VNSGTGLLADLKFQKISGQVKHFTKISLTDFEIVINLVGRKIVERITMFRETIPVQERLVVPLRFLAKGNSYTSLQYFFSISKQAICEIVPEI
jgi:hypothetical protein